MHQVDTPGDADEERGERAEYPKLGSANDYDLGIYATKDANDAEQTQWITEGRFASCRYHVESFHSL
jgi:hypothetical protein